MTHAPFNAVKLDKNSGDDQIVNTVQQQAIGDLLPRDIEMIVSGHVHTFEALSFAAANPPRPPQLVVGTGGVKLAKKPKKPDDIGGAPMSNAFILKDFAYIVWDREGTNWRGRYLAKTARKSRVATWPTVSSPAMSDALSEKTRIRSVGRCQIVV